MTTVTANTPANALNSMDIHNASDVCNSHPNCQAFDRQIREKAEESSDVL